MSVGPTGIDNAVGVQATVTPSIGPGVSSFARQQPEPPMPNFSLGFQPDPDLAASLASGRFTEANMALLVQIARLHHRLLVALNAVNPPQAAAPAADANPPIPTPTVTQ